MIRSRWLTFIILAIGIPMATIFVDRNPTQASNFKRTTEAENDFIVQQLQLLQQNSRTTFKLLDDIDVVRLAFGLPKANDLATDTQSQSQSQSQYQYQTDLAANPIAPEFGEVLNNLTNTFSQLDFERASSNTQIQTLTQSSFETVDEGVYYYQVKPVDRPIGERDNIVRTVLSYSGGKSLGLNNLQAEKKDYLALRVLGNNPGGMLSFFSGIQKLKEESVYLEAKNVGLGNIRSITANNSSIRIERSKYQLDLEEQNQRFLEAQEQRQEDLKKRLEKEQENRKKEKEQAEEQRQEEIADTIKRRQQQIDRLQQNRKKLESNRSR